MYKKLFSVALCIVVTLGVLVVPQLTVFAADDIQQSVSAQQAYDENGDVLEQDAGSNENEAASVGTAEGTDSSEQSADDAAATTSEATGGVAAKAAGMDLQDEVDQASGSATITITEDITLDKTITIPSGKTITLKDDGTKRTIDASSIESAFDVQGTLIIAATSDENLIIKSGCNASHKGGLATIAGDLVLKSAHVYGGTAERINVCGGVVSISDGGSMTMSGGVISDYYVPDQGYVSGGLIVLSDDANFEMTGGSIRDNETYVGIHAMGYDSDAEVTVKISGGEFVNNKSYTSGSAVHANGPGVSLEISGGSFKNNTSDYMGTVFAVRTGKVVISGGEFDGNKAAYGGALAFRGQTGNSVNAEITGGTYTNNSANSGGAIYVSTDDVTISGGTLKNNSAQRWGGGIYVNSNHHIVIKNAVIYENDAQRLGGGLWCCPTGGATIQATEGVAIFDNDTTEEPSAGVDIATVTPQDGNPYLLHLSERVLGGGTVKYYNDGSVQDGSLSAAVADARRYNGNSGDASNIKASSVNSYALKAVMSNQTKASAKAAANLVIKDNTALCGGGIGANGGVYTGFEPGVNPDEWQINVNKVWKDVPATEQKAVTVFLKVNGQILDSVELNKDNGWKATFTDLPNPNAFEEMTVVEGSMEKDADGNEVFKEETAYKVTYDTTKDEANKTIAITVTNEAIPKEPPIEEKVTPPETPNNPPADSGTTEQTSKKFVANSPSPKTDDQAPITLVVLLTIAAATIAWGRFGAFQKK